MDTPAPAPGIRPQSMRRRAILALALTVGFHGLALLLLTLFPPGLILMQRGSPTAEIEAI